MIIQQARKEIATLQRVFQHLNYGLNLQVVYLYRKRFKS